jgi:glycosyltransferase involved in cell wall biosynthesis
VVKLAFIINLYPPYIVGGNEMLAREVIEALRARGHTIHVITGRGRDLAKDGFTHGVLNLDLDRKEESFLGGKTPTPLDVCQWHLYNPKSYLAVRRLLREMQPELVVVWNLYMASMAPLVAARRAGFPLVIHTADKWLLYGLKDIGPLIWPSLKWKQAAVRFVRSVVQPILFRLVRPEPIIAISDFIRRVYLDAGFPPNIQPIHLGVPMTMFSPNGWQRSACDKVRFLYVGALWEGKGPQVAVKALGQFIQRPGASCVHLDIYGHGSAGFIEHLKGIVKENNLDDHVTFHGFVQREQLAQVYKEHDILLFPSIWEEPFAAVPVEAMASGMPVIGTTAGGTPEAVRHGETGLLVPPNDPEAMAESMASLASDPELRRRFGKNAAQAARAKWDLETYIQRLEKRYREIAMMGDAGRR